jgi:hypothetical protein
MMRPSLIALGVLIGAVSPASADVQLSLQSGRVTIVAKDATVRQILVEWARVGQTKIVNVERIPGTPLTIELRDVPEQQALRTLLRSISGYVAAPRTTMAAADTSIFDRIIVMPTLAAATPPSSSGAAPPLTFTQTPPAPPEEEADQQRPNPAQAPGNRGPVFVFPQPQVTGQPAGGVPNPANPGNPLPPPPTFFFQPPATPGAPTTPPAAAYPGAPTTPSPVGVAVPGMVVPGPPPQQPGQPAPQQ